MSTRPDFVHLHLHTEFSLLDGAIRHDALMDQVVAHGSRAVGMTDHGNMFGAISFYEEATARGLKPILGCEMYVAPGSRFEKTSGGIGEAAYHLTVLAMNPAGYTNLCRLVTAGYLEGFYYRPRIDMSSSSSSTLGGADRPFRLPEGEVAMQCGRGRMEEAIETARWYSELFPDRYYIELQENTLAEQDLVNKRLMEVARPNWNLPLVATNDCHYLNREDARAHEVLLCIQTGKTMSDPTHMRFSAEEFYVKTPEEMAAAFSYAPESIANTMVIAERCNLELPVDGKTYYFPHFDPPEGKNHDDMLRELATNGLKERMVTILAQVSGSDCRATTGLLRPAGDRAGMYPQYEISGLLPDRVRLYPLGQGSRHTGRPWQGFGGRITGGLCHQNHRPRSAAVQPAVRALSEPRARVDARLRRRLLPGPPRRGDPLRADKYGESNVGQIITFGALGAKSVCATCAACTACRSQR
jgi:DNA polymerase III alpha subunit